MRPCIFAIVALVLGLGLGACGGPKAFTRGVYGDPEESLLDLQCQDIVLSLFKVTKT